MGANPAAERFQTIPRTQAPFPHNCACCGSVERDFIDFGLTIEYFGAVLVCVECMGAAVIPLGYVVKSEVDKAVADRDLVLVNLLAAQNLITEFVGDLSDTVSDLAASVDHVLFANDGSSDSDPSASVDANAAEDASESAESDSESDGQNDEPSIDEGSNGVPSRARNVLKFD